MKKQIVLITLIIVLIASVSFLNMTKTDILIFEDSQIEVRLDIVNKNSETIVVFIAGSGPTDYNGNSNIIDGRNDSLLQLSKGLNDFGINTFRYNKRHVGKTSKLIEPDFNVFVDDLIDCISWLKANKYSNIYLAGHSQGSLVAALAAREIDVSGVISIAGAARTIDEVLYEQMVSMGQKDLADTVIKSLQNGKLYLKDESILDSQFSKMNQQFILTWMEHNPLEVYSKLDTKILFLQGDKDSQVTLDELDAFRTLNHKSVVLKDTNHVLKIVDSEKDNSNSYSDPSYKLSDQLINEINDFIK
jgi:esterase/lipase